MMRRFTSSPNPRGPRRHVHRRHVVGVDAQPVAHAVVAREVGARLGRGEQVVRRQPEPQLGHRELDDARTGRLERGGRTLDGRDDVGGGAVDELAHEPDAPAVDAVVERARRRDGAGSSSDVESIGSCPAITSRHAAASATVRASGPIWSSELAKAISP